MSNEEKFKREKREREFNIYKRKFIYVCVCVFIQHLDNSQSHDLKSNVIHCSVFLKRV